MTGSPRYCRNPAVSVTEVDNEIFLVEPGTQEVYYLDTIAAALWRLLADPLDLDDIVAVYCTAFPDTGMDIVRRDLDRAIQDLRGRGFVTVAPSPTGSGS